MERFQRSRHGVTRHCATFLAALWIAAPAFATVPLENIGPRTHRAPAGATLDDIRDSIVQGAGELGWDLRESEPDRVRVSIVVQSRHEATVDIRFDADTFAIDYVVSMNLDYTETGIGAAKRSQKSNLRRLTTEQTFDLGPRIHEDYNQWVRTLANRVEQRIAQRPPDPRRPPAEVTEPATPNAEPPVLVADELEKLDGLRRRGVLTEAEFQAQKAKLLSR